VETYSVCVLYHLYDHETDANMKKLGKRQEWGVVNKEKKVEVEREDVNNPEQEVGDEFINVSRRKSKTPMSQPQTPIVDEVSAIGNSYGPLMEKRNYRWWQSSLDFR